MGNSKQFYYRAHNYSLPEGETRGNVKRKFLYTISLFILMLRCMFATVSRALLQRPLTSVHTHTHTNTHTHTHTHTHIRDLSIILLFNYSQLHFYLGD